MGFKLVPYLNTLSVSPMYLLDPRLRRRGAIKSLLFIYLSVHVLDLSSGSNDFSNFFRKERKEYFKNNYRARFLKKNFPGAPGVKTGDFHAKLEMAHYLYLIYSRSALYLVFSKGTMSTNDWPKKEFPKKMP